MFGTVFFALVFTTRALRKFNFYDGCWYCWMITVTYIFCGKSYHQTSFSTRTWILQDAFIIVIVFRYVGVLHILYGIEHNSESCVHNFKIQFMFNLKKEKNKRDLKKNGKHGSTVVILSSKKNITQWRFTTNFRNSSIGLAPLYLCTYPSLPCITHLSIIQICLGNVLNRATNLIRIR